MESCGRMAFTVLPPEERDCVCRWCEPETGFESVPFVDVWLVALRICDDGLLSKVVRLRLAKVVIFSTLLRRLPIVVSEDFSWLSNR